MSKERSNKEIDKLYSNLTYFDVYGGSIFFCIFLILVLLLCAAYLSVMTQIEPIKANWPTQRCSPRVIPFAGFINKPIGSTVFEATQDNFNYCVQSMMTSFVGYALEPITFITSNATNAFSQMGKALNAFRVQFSNMRTNTGSIVEFIYGQIMNIVTPIQKIIITFIDSIAKINGIFTAGLYTSLGTYYALKSVLGAVVEAIIAALGIMAGIIVAMWILPFTWPVALAGTATFLSISIPLALIITFLTDKLHVPVNNPIPGLPGPPPMPSCFDESTRLQMADGKWKTIDKVNVGDILLDNDKITAKLKLDAQGQTMYDVHGVIVSGSHPILFHDKWILVKDHPERKRITNYRAPYIYCMNTESKTIKVNGLGVELGLVFSDWDEITNDKERHCLIAEGASTAQIHSLYDGGFFEDTLIEKEDGTHVTIADLEIGATLKGGHKVVGTVQVWHENLEQPATSEMGVNIHRVDGIRNGGLHSRRKKLCHLITDSMRFNVNGVDFYHYSSCTELFLKT
jgi:hypothetical protein